MPEDLDLFFKFTRLDEDEFLKSVEDQILGVPQLDFFSAEDGERFQIAVGTGDPTDGKRK